MSELTKLEAYYSGKTSVSWSPINGLEAGGYEESNRRIDLKELNKIVDDAAVFLRDVTQIRDKVKNL